MTRFNTQTRARGLRAAAVIVVVLVGAVFAAACGGSDDPPLIHVFTNAPWTGNETINYNIVDQGGGLNGTCVLTTVVDKSPGKTELEHQCKSATSDDHDDRTAVVDSKTLTPESATRVLSNATKNTRTTFTSTYNVPGKPGVVQFNANDNGHLHQTTRDLPTPSQKSPDPGYYDDETLFWIVRGITLQKGWQGAYDDVSSSTVTIFTARFTVEDQENVTVPAGAFSAWKVRLDTSSVTQYLWVDAAAPHHVVKANIESVTYELTSAK